MAFPTAADVVAALPDVDVVAVRAGRRTIIAAAPVALVADSGPDAFERLDALAPGFWAGFATYELGRAVERVRPRTDGGEPGLPDSLWARFDARLVLDPVSRRLEVHGARRSRRLLERAVVAAAETAAAPGSAVRLEPTRWRSSLDRHAFETRVGAILELLHAGDCYQVNLTRRLRHDTPIDPVTLFALLETRHPAPHAAFLRLRTPDGEPLSVVSASPERFLAWRERAVETRPIKGTGVNARQLVTSEKDRAENVMIVDLARNDLGRVCEPGSVHVPALCSVESHPGLCHLVSTVRGRLRTRAHPGALLRATFPPASVTGAPKPRVLQAIEDLEPVPRGVYCGALGWIDTLRGSGDLSVAIRTFTIRAGGVELGVGAGIVADSRPEAEWRETELKAARLVACAAAGPSEARPTALAS